MNVYIPISTLLSTCKMMVFNLTLRAKVSVALFTKNRKYSRNFFT